MSSTKAKLMMQKTLALNKKKLYLEEQYKLYKKEMADNTYEVVLAKNLKQRAHLFI